ncbi:MAG: NUDIX domain-containing protein [Solirubrobacteraceae bacterium]
MAATRTSAGILLFRGRGHDLEVLIAHMGGPFWAKKDDHAWSIVKGEYDVATEPAFDAARREFHEETGHPLPDGPTLALGEVRQSGGKTVEAWAVEADFDPAALVPGTFELEWPPRSGRTQAFPEIDRVAWVTSEVAARKLVKAQAAFVDRLVAARADASA